MCANYQPLRPEFAPQLDLFPPTFAYSSDIYPSHNSPILVNYNNHMEWREALFGMVPSWAKDNKICRSTYNARSETVHEKPSFKHAWQQRQFALVPVERFYEPRYQSDPTGHEKAERWAIERQDEQPFTIAALYELSEQNGQLVRSMTMLTINADGHPLMQQFHAPNDEKRSVVVIPPELRLQWLTASQKMAHDMLFELRTNDYKTYAAPR